VPPKGSLASCTIEQEAIGIVQAMRIRIVGNRRKEGPDVLLAMAADIRSPHGNHEDGALNDPFLIWRKLI
jgi:hypothetical protein